MVRNRTFMAFACAMAGMVALESQLYLLFPDGARRATGARTVDWLLCGVVVVEALFVIPGLGTVLMNAVAERDVPVVQGLAVVFGVATVLLNLGADLVTHRLAPRMGVAA